MFPRGAAGLGLIVLRLCCASAILALAADPGESATPTWAGVGLGCLALSLLVGALTPIACTVGAVVEALILVHGHEADPGRAALALLATVALGLIGPGAYSIDAKLFGRRRIMSNVD